MKAALGSVGAAVAASACCIGPVVFSLLGAGALSAASTRLEPYRPWFIGTTVALLGGAFYAAYRPVPANAACEDGTCAPTSRRTAKILVWIAAVLAAVLVTFPYYIGYFM